jgi:hypothetical protein
VSSRLWNLKENNRNQIKFLSLCLAPHKATYSFLIPFPLVGSSDKTSLAADVAIACLKNANSNLHDDDDYLRTFSAMLFPLLLILPKVSCSFVLTYVWFSNVSIDGFNQASHNWLVFVFLILYCYLQTQRLNLKALQLAKEVKWPLYQNLVGTSSTEMVNYLLVIFCSLRYINLVLMFA